MTIAAALVLGAGLMAWVAPVPLRKLTSRVRDATVGIVCWIMSMAAALGTFAVGVGLLLLPGDRPNGSLAYLTAGCWTAQRHGRVPELDELAGATGAVLLIILLFRFARVGSRTLAAQRRVHGAHLAVLGIAGRTGVEPPYVLWLDHDAPLAYSVGGRPGVVVATKALHRLPAAQQAAVLCHEHEHLRGRHHLLAWLVRALAKASPVVPLFRHAPAAMGLLVEYAADAAAVRRYGPRAVQAALLALQHGRLPDAALAMTGGDLQERLWRVADPGPSSGALRRTLARGAAAVGPLILPAALGLGALLFAQVVSCSAS
jgi:hypothetical protein